MSRRGNRKKRKSTRDRIMGQIFQERKERRQTQNPAREPKQTAGEKKKARAAAFLIHAMDAADEHGFTAQCLNPFPAHWRFTSADKRQQVDYWPGTGRYWLVGSRSKGRIDDIAELLAQISGGCRLDPQARADLMLIADQPWLTRIQ